MQTLPHLETLTLYYWLMELFLENREEESENEPPHKQSKQQGAEGGIDDIEVQCRYTTMLHVAPLKSPKQSF